MDKEKYTHGIRMAELATYAGIGDVRMSPAQVDAWVGHVTSHLDVIEVFGRRYLKVIHLPRRGTVEALSTRRRSVIEFFPAGRVLRVILHELSHQYCDRQHGPELPAHSVEFAQTHTTLAGIVLGQRFATNLSTRYKKNGVPV